MPDSPAFESALEDALAGTTTLVLRPANRATELVALIEQAGGQALVSPLISRAQISDDTRASLDSLTQDLGRFAWVAVTSVNAVDELAQSIARTHPGVALRDAARETRWASVGPATTRALETRGIVVNHEAAENSAAGLLANWPEVPNPSQPAGTTPDVLLPLGNLASTQLEEGLGGMGYRTTRITAYLTVSHPASEDALAAYRAGDVDAVIVTSGSGVREFVKQFDPLAHSALTGTRPIVVAIGEPSARTANAMGLGVDTIAHNATNRGLFDALIRGFALTKEK